MAHLGVVSLVPFTCSSVRVQEQDNLHLKEKLNMAKQPPTTQEPQAATPNRKPVHKIRTGRIRLAVWKNSTENGVRYNVTVSKLYKAGVEWKSTDSYGRDDLPVLSSVLQQAHTWIYQRQQLHE
jgi:hypothetical protein